MQVVGYTRVSTREQAEGRLSLDSQRRTIAAEARRREWGDVEGWMVSGQFPNLRYADGYRIELIERG